MTMARKSSLRYENADKEKIACRIFGGFSNGDSILIFFYLQEMVYEYEEAMEQSYLTSLVKAFKKNITDGYFNFIILDCINEKILDYEEMWSFAKTKGFQVSLLEFIDIYHIYQ